MINVQLLWRSLAFKNESSDKDFDLCMLSVTGLPDQGERHLVIRRWGKTGTAGQIMAQRYTNSWRARKEFDAIEEKQRGNGYSQKRNKDVSLVRASTNLLINELSADWMPSKHDATIRPHLRWLTGEDQAEREAMRQKTDQDEIAEAALERADTRAAEQMADWGTW